LKKNQLILGVSVLVALVALALYEQHLHPFNFQMFFEEFQKANWQKICFGIGCIYAA